MTHLPHSFDNATMHRRRHARLFDLYRTIDAPQPDPPAAPAGACRDETLPPEAARHLQQTAIASLSRETPWPQRIFRKNRSGLPGA